MCALHSDIAVPESAATSVKSDDEALHAELRLHVHRNIAAGVRDCLVVHCTCIHKQMSAGREPVFSCTCSHYQVSAVMPAAAHLLLRLLPTQL